MRILEILGTSSFRQTQIEVCECCVIMVALQVAVETRNGSSEMGWTCTTSHYIFLSIVASPRNSPALYAATAGASLMVRSRSGRPSNNDLASPHAVRIPLQTWLPRSQNLRSLGSVGRSNWSTLPVRCQPLGAESPPQGHHLEGAAQPPGPWPRCPLPGAGAAVGPALRAVRVAAAGVGGDSGAHLATGGGAKPETWGLGRAA